jgi:hypothetical protein
MVLWVNIYLICKIKLKTQELSKIDQNHEKSWFHYCLQV